jgi:hypothetical protein
MVAQIGPTGIGTGSGSDRGDDDPTVDDERGDDAERDVEHGVLTLAFTPDMEHGRKEHQHCETRGGEGRQPGQDRSGRRDQANRAKDSIIAAELGTVVIGGLLSSTFLTLLVVPAVSSLVAGVKGRLPWASSAATNKAEAAEAGLSTA